jgi:hypothetical protein
MIFRQGIAEVIEVVNESRRLKVESQADKTPKLI